MDCCMRDAALSHAVSNIAFARFEKHARWKFELNEILFMLLVRATHWHWPPQASLQQQIYNGMLRWGIFGTAAGGPWPRPQFRRTKTAPIHFALQEKRLERIALGFAFVSAK